MLFLSVYNIISNKKSEFNPIISWNQIFDDILGMQNWGKDDIQEYHISHRKQTQTGTDALMVSKSEK